MLEAKAEVNGWSFSERQKSTALHLAVLGGHRDAVALLLKANADINVKTKDEKTPILLAIEDITEITSIAKEFGAQLRGRKNK